MKIISTTIRQTGRLAEDLVKGILKVTGKKAVVVALVGDLGAGKTTFVQGFAKALGVKEKITSPTFVILKCFKLHVSCFKKLIHIDAYRIDDSQEILDLGWEGLIKDSKNIIIIEWAEKIKKILPKDCIWTNFRHISETERQIEIQRK